MNECQLCKKEVDVNDGGCALMVAFCRNHSTNLTNISFAGIAIKHSCKSQFADLRMPPVLSGLEWRMTMKVKSVMPCICTKEPDFTADGTAGMPVLRPFGGHDNFWHIWCPKCQRGVPSFDYSSPFKALKAWNEMQEHLRTFDCWEVTDNG